MNAQKTGDVVVKFGGSLGWMLCGGGWVYGQILRDEGSLGIGERSTGAAARLASGRRLATSRIRLPALRSWSQGAAGGAPARGRSMRYAAR